MSATATAIATAQNLLRDKVMDKLRANPKAWGKVTVEITIQDGAIKTITASENETVKPQP